MPSARLFVSAMMIAASLGVGCTLLVSTSGLDTEHVDAAGSDGANGGTSDGAGGADAVGDALLSNDASADGSVAFCAANPGHTFCDDFDESTDVTQNWQDHGASGRGIATGDTMLWRSSPRSFFSSTPSGPSGISTANVSRPLGTSDRVRYSFAIFVTPPVSDAGDSFATIRFPGSTYIDFLWYSDGTVTLTERMDGAPNLDHQASSGITANQWVRLEVEVTPGHIKATIDTANVIDATTARSYTGAISVSLGLYSNDALAIGFHYDNVIADLAF